jgi:hypothetical protein
VRIEVEEKGLRVVGRVPRLVGGLGGGLKRENIAALKALSSKGTRLGKEEFKEPTDTRTARSTRSSSIVSGSTSAA